MQVGAISACTCLYLSTFFPITWLYFVLELEKCTLAQIHYHELGTEALQVQQIFLYLTLLFTENRFGYCKKIINYDLIEKFVACSSISLGDYHYLMLRHKGRTQSVIILGSLICTCTCLYLSTFFRVGAYLLVGLLCT